VLRFTPPLFPFGPLPNAYVFRRFVCSLVMPPFTLLWEDCSFCLFQPDGNWRIFPPGLLRSPSRGFCGFCDPGRLRQRGEKLCDVLYPTTSRGFDSPIAFEALSPRLSCSSSPFLFNFELSSPPPATICCLKNSENSQKNTIDKVAFRYPSSSRNVSNFYYCMFH